MVQVRRECHKVLSFYVAQHCPCLFMMYIPESEPFSLNMKSCIGRI